MRSKKLFDWYSSLGEALPDFFVSQDGDGVGTEADPFGPAELVTALATMEDNKIVAFKKGDTFEIGELDIAQSGLTFTAYGEGDDPILTGSEDISGLVWTDEGSGVYSAPMVTEPNWIWIAGGCAKNAETARIPIVSRADTTHFTIDDSDVSAYTSIVGSYLVAKQQQFRNSQRVTVTNYNDATGVITVDEAIPTSVSQVDLVLYNNTEYLSGNNEWAWDDGTLYVKAAASPSTLNIRSSAFDYCFKTTAAATFKNLEIQEYFQFGIWSDGGVVSVTHCSFHDIRDSGVLIQRGVSGVSISSNTFERLGNGAIWARPTSNSTYNSNTINDIGMQANYGWQTWSDGDGSLVVNGVQHTGAGILIGTADLEDDTVRGSGNIIRYNTITNTAYNGITLSTSTDNFVQYNHVTDYMNRFDDGGGIYTFHYRLYELPQENTEISYNYVSDSNSATLAPGIYIDNRTILTNIHHNIVDDCQWGIYLNYDTYGHTIDDNIVRNCAKGIVFGQADNTLSTLYLNNTDNQMSRNIIASIVSTQRCLGFEIAAGTHATWNPFSGTGGADNNIYINPYGVNIADSDNEGNDLTLSELQAAYGEDANSTERTNYITAPGVPTQNILLITNQTNAAVNGTAPDGYETAAGVTTTDYTIPAYYGLLLLAHAASENSIFFTSSSSQKVDLGTAADIQFERTDPFSVSFWFKIPANPAAAQIIMSNLDTTLNRGWQAQVQTTGDILFELRNTAATNRFNIQTNVTDYADNAWHHCLIVKPGTFANTKIYIDGVDDSATPNNNLTQTIVSTQNLNIATRASNVAYFDGYLDEMAIWNTDETANVAAIYNAGLTHDLRVLDSPPIHYWKLGDDGYVDSGTSATPLHGTAINTPTISTDVP